MSYSKEMPLSDWQKMFMEIYFPTRNYGRSRFELFTHMVKVFGAGSHFLFRRHDPAGTQRYLAKVFAWYCALATRLGVDVEKALWEKYPRVCPRCLATVCECGQAPAPIQVERLQSIALERSSQRPVNLRDWQIMFANLYKGPFGGSEIPQDRDRVALVFARIAEELGEVGEAILIDASIDANAEFIVRNEMADLGAWIFALANNTQHICEAGEGTYLADEVWDYYPGKCHYCQEVPCLCVSGTLGHVLAEQGAMSPSHFDERTGLADDKALRRYIENAEKNAGPGNHEWGFIFLDVDNFKAVNTNHSHKVGDIVLLEVAQRIKAAVGNQGIVFRRGGEEFAVVLRSGFEPTLATAETIRRAVDALPIDVQHEGKRVLLSVTVSLGVAACYKDGSPIQLEGVAEARSRKAKADGKNRVEPPLSEEFLKRWKFA